MENVDNPLEVKEYFLKQSQNNKTCFDCGATYPTHVSINNGIIICENCALIHQTLSPHVSYVRKLDEPWDKYLFLFMERGGNHNLSIFLERYFPVELTLQNPEMVNIYTCPIEMRYKSVILDFYRKQLRSEVLMEEPPANPDNFTLLNQIENENGFPEFVNYKLYEGQIKVESITELRTKQIQDIANNVGKNVYEAGKVAVPAVKNAVGYIVEKSLPIIAKTFAGLGYLFYKASGALEKMDEKEVKKETKKEVKKEKEIKVEKEIKKEDNIQIENQKAINIQNDNNNNVVNMNNVPQGNAYCNMPAYLNNVPQGNNYVEDPFKDVDSQYPTLSQLPK